MAAITTYGDGSDGAYTAGNITRGATLNYTTFTLNSTISVTGGTGLTTIYVQGAMSLGASAVMNCIKQTIGAQPGDIDIFGGAYNANRNTEGAFADSAGVGGRGGNISEVVPESAGGAGGTGTGGTGAGGARGTGGGYGGQGPEPTPGAAGQAASSVRAPGGGGGGGGDSIYYSSGGNGGAGGEGGSAIEEQPTILFIVGGDITINAAAVINGAGVDGVNGTVGVVGNPGNSEGCGGGGGGGGGASGGGSAVKLLMFYAGTYTNAGTLTAIVGGAGTGGAGGTGGAQGGDNPSPYKIGSDGAAGGNSSEGTYAGIITVIKQTAITRIFKTQIDAAGQVEFDGIAASERGFVYDTTTAPDITDTKEIVAGTGELSATITGLTAGETYFIRPYATNAIETTYGPEVEFKMQPAFLPLIATGG